MRREGGREEGEDERVAVARGGVEDSHELVKGKGGCQSEVL